MGYNKGFIQYILKAPFTNTVAMYIYGSGLWSLWTLFMNIISSNSVELAISNTIKWYILKFAPYELDVLLTGGIPMFVENWLTAIVIGSIGAGVKWWWASV